MLLALDTTDGMCNVGVSRENSLLAFSEFSIHRGTSDIIFPQIEKTLMKANITLPQLSGFVVCTGPGNYTSLRIAISAIRGMALACGKPSVGVNLFDLLSEKKRPALVIIKGPADKVFIQKFSLEIVPEKPTVTDVAKVKKRQDLANLSIIGHEAKTIAKAVGGAHVVVTNEEKIRNLIELGLVQINNNKQRPSAVYIR